MTDRLRRNFRYIDGLYVSEVMGAAKPDAAFFDMIPAKIGEPRETCVMIGESLASDMPGAKNAELKSVRFMPSGNAEEAMAEYDIDRCGSDFDELYAALEKRADGRE